VSPNNCRGYIPAFGEVLNAKEGADNKEVFDFGIETPSYSEDLTNFMGETVKPEDHE